MSSSWGSAFSSLRPLSFRRTSSKLSRAAIYTLHPLVDAFQSRLNSALRWLQESCGESSYLSAEWLGQALQVCLAVHSRAGKLFPHLIQQAVLHENQKLVDQLLDATVKILDVCNALKEMIWDIKEYQASLKMIVRGLEVFTENPICAGQLLRTHTALGNCKEFMFKKEAQSPEASCSSMLRKIAEKLPMNQTSGDSSQAQFFEILYGSMATTVFVCGVLVAALSFKSKRSLPAAPNYVGHCLWESALHGLQHKVKEEIDRKRRKGARARLQELDNVDAAVRHLYDVVNRCITRESTSWAANVTMEVKRSVQGLKKCIVEMDAIIAHFGNQVDKLFKVVIGGRTALLDSLSYSYS